MKCENVNNACIVGAMNVLAAGQTVRSNTTCGGDGVSRPAYEVGIRRSRYRGGYKPLKTSL
ncbi:MAG: hypothetical protein LBF22_14155 [Deltaproteobacteria bacterium]|nr:hypothetical protein [Deltaproteobacteria bacterium]